MKHIISVLLALTLAMTPLMGLADAAADFDIAAINEIAGEDAVFVDYEYELVPTLLDFCAWGAANGLFGLDEAAAKIADEYMAFDYSEPKLIAVIRLSDQAFSDILSSRFDIGAEPAADDIMRLMRIRMLNLPAATLNGMAGVEWLTASSALQISDMAIIPNIESGAAYVVSYYGDAAHLTVAAFTVDSNGATGMNAGFLNLAGNDAVFDRLFKPAAEADSAMEGLSHSVYRLEYED